MPPAVNLSHHSQPQAHLNRVLQRTQTFLPPSQCRPSASTPLKKIFWTPSLFRTPLQHGEPSANAPATMLPNLLMPLPQTMKEALLPQFALPARLIIRRACSGAS